MIYSGVQFHPGIEGNAIDYLRTLLPSSATLLDQLRSPAPTMLVSEGLSWDPVQDSVHSRRVQVELQPRKYVCIEYSVSITPSSDIEVWLDRDATLFALP